MVGAAAVNDNALAEQLAAALEEIDGLRLENERLRALLGLDIERTAEPPTSWEPTLFASPAPPRSSVDRRSSPADKVQLFRSLFSGRDDVYAVRWQNDRSGKSGWSPKVVGGWANSKRPDREHEPLTDAVIEQHLAGDESVGLYPLLRNDRCRLLVCDFDGGSWALDALAYLDACRASGLPAVLERSRSGDGGHVWVFFSGSVPAADARKVGAAMLRRAMASRVEIDLSSYDRLFPSQDTMPKGSFGNLIALPLQGACRKRGTTVFLDPTTLEPYEDQWAFLCDVPLASPESITNLASAVRPLAVGSDARDWERQRDQHPAPAVVRAALSGMLAIERIGLPAWMIAQLKHLASLHNPKFYENERLRLSNHATPRLIRCYTEELDLLRVPRGLLDATRSIIESAGSRFELEDQRNQPDPIEVASMIVLDPIQQIAVDAVVSHDHALLVAPTGSGKTVMACALIAEHRVPTLILVDRTPLVEQWKTRLMEHLGLTRRQIGRVAATAKASGIVDIATYQALARRPDAAALFDGYGLVIVDECHHLPARSFELAVRDAVHGTGSGSPRPHTDATGSRRSSTCTAGRFVTRSLSPTPRPLRSPDASTSTTRHRPPAPARSAPSRTCSAPSSTTSSGPARSRRTSQMPYVPGATCWCSPSGPTISIRSPPNSPSGGSNRWCSRADSARRREPQSSTASRTTPNRPDSYCSPPVPTSARASTHRASTRCSSRFHSRSRGASCSTSAASCGPPTPRPTSKSTTTSTPARCSARCTPNASPPTRPSASTSRLGPESGRTISQGTGSASVLGLGSV